jgi:hypothetical protein
MIQSELGTKADFRKTPPVCHQNLTLAALSSCCPLALWARALNCTLACSIARLPCSIARPPPASAPCCKVRQHTGGGLAEVVMTHIQMCSRLTMCA